MNKPRTRSELRAFHRLIGGVLAELRERHNYSTAELAFIMGWRERRVVTLETGKRPLDFVDGARLAALYHLKVSALLAVTELDGEARQKFFTEAHQRP